MALQTTGYPTEEIMLNRRQAFPCQHNQWDYMDGDYRRICAINGIIDLTDKVIEEKLVLVLDECEAKIRIHNCALRQAVGLKRGQDDYPVKFSVFESDLAWLSMGSDDAESVLSIDKSRVQHVFVSGNFALVDVFMSSLQLFQAEGFDTKRLKFEKAHIDQLALYYVRAAEVFCDDTAIAIKDWTRFKPLTGQAIQDVAEQYHALLLPATRTLQTNVAVRYQLARATSHPIAALFGYFYRPLIVIRNITLTVILFGILYALILPVSLSKGLFFSVYTFFTIGYGDLVEGHTLVKTLLVFAEALAGVVYAAALLVSLMNSTRKSFA